MATLRVGEDVMVLLKAYKGESSLQLKQVGEELILLGAAVIRHQFRDDFLEYLSEQRAFAVIRVQKDLVAQLIHDALKAQNMTHQQLADAARLSVSYLSAILGGDIICSEKALRKLFDVLGIDAEKVVKGEGKSRKKVPTGM